MDVKKLGELVEQGLNVNGISSSSLTESWAREFKIPLTDFSDVQLLDLAIDGADEIDPSFHLIKGGGGSLVREKVVNAHSKKLIIVADQSKRVDVLGKFPLPVEVLQFGWQMTANKIVELGAKPVLREENGSVYVSDNGNYILDCAFESIPDPENLHNKLKQLIGVIETGLFFDMVDMVIMGGPEGTVVINKQIYKDLKTSK
ncbi:Ribose 5-phosphate isomerase A [Planococcus halocryophilus Or1]|uniref:ribose-5-phosphate isomerase RpiA n=1 Tax=Planococcus halocryophilus TaxID=1215089 RepID=UPI0002B86650|nr:ribose-5-phosphate isomerase RpiA [Planococcus halocryophilus]EMF46738.1 Ribose 5-phosphate isomerase A [Planococcus halocryophilus Or1]